MDTFVTITRILYQEESILNEIGQSLNLTKNSQTIQNKVS